MPDDPSDLPAARPATLGRVLEHLGTTVLDLVCGADSSSDDVRAVAIYDPMDEQQFPPGALVLCIGVSGTDEVAAVVEHAGTRGAAGVILRAPVAMDPAVRAAVDRAAVALLGLVPGASWTQLLNLLDGLLTEGNLATAGASDTIAGLPAGDLFAVANAIGELLDAPVTIEDRNSRVLAFSGRQDEADSSRAETILGRQVPPRYARLLEERGAFRDLYSSNGPIFVDLRDHGVIPRTAVAVRAGDEILGSIWAAVQQRLTAAREQAFVDVANIVALHMLRLRAGADVERRLRTDLVATALEGGRSAVSAMGRLSLLDAPTVVLALGVHDPFEAEVDAQSLVAREAHHQHVSDALGVHLSAIHPRAAVALLGEVTYGIMPVVGNVASGDLQAARTAADFLARVGDRANAQIGVGRVAPGRDGLAGSRQDADRALRVLQSRGPAHKVARLVDVHNDALLLELAELASGDDFRPSGPISRLQEYDADHHTDLVASLRAWLDAFGDAVQAGRAVHVHVNTFRYRLRRIASNNHRTGG